MNVNKVKLTKLDEDDFEVGKDIKKKEVKYIFECDISDEKTTSYEQGIENVINKFM